MLDKSAKLCYIDGNVAYFTTKDLEDQWGDDWDDVPYECNAGGPYTPCWHRKKENCKCSICMEDYNKDGSPKWTIYKVMFETPLITPSECFTVSVLDINKGKVPWLFSEHGYGSDISIYAGVTIEEFIELIEKSGGVVYLPKEK